jgi:hypothetical protein
LSDDVTQSDPPCWEGKTNLPLLDQVAAIREVVEYGASVIDQMERFEAEGVSPDAGAVTVTLRSAELHAVCTALNMLGWFDEKAGRIADGVLERMIASQEFSPEDELAIEVAGQRIAEKGMAEMFGISVEEYRKLREEARAELDDD